MDAYRAIVTKRDTRDFAERPLPREVLQRILQAGRMAGSAKNAQPVRFVVLESFEQRARLAECGRFTPHVVSCAVAIAIVLEPEDGDPEKPFAIFRGPFDAGRAAQNMMVAAWAEGIASCPASMHDEACAADVLALPPGHVVANVIAFGFPADDAVLGRGQPRLPLDTYVHHERWGT